MLTVSPESSFQTGFPSENGENARILTLRIDFIPVEFGPTNDIMKPALRLDILVVGGINSDYLIQGSTLPKPGETIDGQQFFEGPGGKGANQAVGAARLGSRVAFVGCIGRDERGDDLLRGLKNEGVDSRFVIRDSKAATGAALIMVDHRAEKQIMTAPGANHALRVQHIRKVFDRISARVVLLQFEAPLSVVTAAAQLGRKAGAQIILDPAPPVAAPNKKILALVDVIRPNSSEAEALTGICVSDRASARKAAHALLARGVRAVAIQAGEEGNLLVWQGGEELLPKIPVKSIDATGAGDAFAAAFALGLAEGRSLIDAGRMANAAAALATTKIGAQTALPRRHELDRLLSRIGPKRFSTH